MARTDSLINTVEINETYQSSDAVSVCVNGRESEIGLIRYDQF